MFYEVYSFFFRYTAPINLSLMWNYGVIALIFLFIQLLTGIFISMNYLASSDLAFLSVENIMRNVNYGWFLRYVHANGASFFFFSVYMHILRNLRFYSYLPPRREVWTIGVLILLVMIITAFTGYVLPWGQMSFWAATVITNLASAIPIMGEFIVIWLWGGFSVSSITLNRFFTFHFLLPFVILALVFLHLIFLHSVGSSSRVSLRTVFDKIQFQIFFTLKDVYFINYVLIIFVIIVGFYPNILGHPDNYIPANPLVTPAHIVPEWYFLLYYAMLRSIPSKIGGVLILLFSIIILFIFPYFIRFSKRVTNKLLTVWHESSYYERTLKIEKEILELFTSSNKNILFFTFWLFVVACVLLFLIGGKPIERPFLEIGRWCTLFYFFYFYFIVDIFNNLELEKFQDELIEYWINYFQSYMQAKYVYKKNKEMLEESRDLDRISIFLDGEREVMWYLVYLRSLELGADFDEEAGKDGSWF